MTRSSPPARLVVRTPGLLTTVQDTGRWGWQHVGVPVGGAMDLVAYERANCLVGNAPSAAVLEATLEGPTLEIVGHVRFALTGAEFGVTLNGEPVPHELPCEVARGGWLAMGRARRGARAYLAVSGGLDTPLVLGSRSTSPGVLGGRGLRPGEVLPVGPFGETSSGRRSTPGAPAALPARRVRAARPCLRVLPLFDTAPHQAALAVLCANPYRLDAQSNRMGYRLHGAALDVPADRRGSSGTAAGLLQVPADGQPILLMADRQTTGGYPTVGVVISADLPVAAQLAPGETCCFEVCSRQDAMTALLAQQRAERAWRSTG